MQDTHITLAHGNGGRFMRELIQEVFARHLANDSLDTRLDAVTLPWNAVKFFTAENCWRFLRAASSRTAVHSTNRVSTKSTHVPPTADVNITAVLR